VQWFINAQKDEGRRPADLKDEGQRRPTPHDRSVCALPTALRRYRLWWISASCCCEPSSCCAIVKMLLEHYQARFEHLLVDEFQDTNAIQYRWLRLLAGTRTVPFIVGDDDQSIYRWRGARVENLQHFQRDFPGTRIVRLEQNYRSTATILNAANAVIANNSARLGKNLWTDGSAGEPIRLYAAFNERDEAEFVVNRIRDAIAAGERRRDLAVLYRSNAQSRVFEEALLAAGVPYRVYGGMRFFERAEIKDALAYLEADREP
jgi:DNA helicase II / ATP-dependent DNA helicase PcrA